MVEHKFFTDQIPEVSTAEWHAPRDRAPHLEQEGHQPRLYKALDYAGRATESSALNRLPSVSPVTLVDLGAGDGGLLSMVKDQLPEVSGSGFDFTPANVEGAKTRGVNVHFGDFMELFPKWWPWVDIVIMTEVLEHMADPHRWLAFLARHCGWLVASSPDGETPENHTAYHTWGWDMDGYAQMLHRAGFDVVAHENVGGMFQVVLAKSSPARW